MVFNTLWIVGQGQGQGIVRVRVYPSGFMITVKPHGKQEYYKRSKGGAEKPVAMLAVEGKKERYNTTK